MSSLSLSLSSAESSMDAAAPLSNKGGQHNVDLDDSEDLSTISLGSVKDGESYGAVDTTKYFDKDGNIVDSDRASMLSSVSNLSNTILGAGMLGLPFAIESMGLGLGIFMLILSGLGAYWGLHLLTLEGRYTSKGNASFYSLALLTYPKLAIAIDVTMAVKCFGVATSYLIVIADLMPDATKFFVSAFGGTIDDNSFFISRTFWLLIFLVPAVVLASLKKLNEWHFTSYFAMATVVYILGLVFYFYLTLPKPDVTIPWVRFNTQFFSALPIFFFAFTCHQNILTIFNELKADEEATNKVSQISISASAVIYLAIGIFGYFTFGEGIKPNILRGYPSTDIAVTIARVAISLHVLYSYRLQMHPSRKSVLNIVKHFAPKKSEHWLAHWIVTFVLCALSFLIAFLVDNLGIVFGIIGASGSTMICYILPGAFYLGLKKGEPWYFTKVMAMVSLVAGVIIMVTCVTFIILNATLFSSSSGGGGGH